jgi:hypothetical protein
MYKSTCFILFCYFVLAILLSLITFGYAHKSVQFEFGHTTLRIPNPNAILPDQAARLEKYNTANTTVIEYGNASLLYCDPKTTEKCSTDVILHAKWFKETELVSSLEYEFCIAPGKPKRALDQFTGVRIIHYHMDHKAFDQVYEVCGVVGPNKYNPCKKKIQQDRCYSGEIDHLPVRFESPNSTTGTYMELHLIGAVDKQAQRRSRQQAHEDRTHHIIRDIILDEHKKNITTTTVATSIPNAEIIV